MCVYVFTRTATALIWKSWASDFSPPAAAEWEVQLTWLEAHLQVNFVC